VKGESFSKKIPPSLFVVCSVNLKEKIYFTGEENTGQRKKQISVSRARFKTYD
jgi:hypothetical protein